MIRSGSGNLIGVSVPWSGFINRKLIKLLFIVVPGQFQSRGRDLLIGNGTGLGDRSQGKWVSVPWSGFINRKINGEIHLGLEPVFQSRGRDLLIGNRLGCSGVGV